MTDYRSMFDSEFVGAWDLNGKEVTVTIARVVGGNITGEGGRKAKKPIVYFEGREKGLVCNKTNGKTIAGMYGPIVEDWVGKRVTLYATETQMGGETKQCIRIRPMIPKGSRKTDSSKTPEPGSGCPECGEPPDPNCGACFGTGRVSGVA